MTFLQNMDRFVHVTRLDRIALTQIEPRNLRWSPVLVIVALVGGYALMASAQSVFVRAFWIGWLLFYGAVVAASFMRVFGPRFTPTMDHPLDERELMLKSHAHAISGTVLATLTMFGCFYMTSAGAPFLWHPHSVMDWINLGFGVQAASLLLPTWIASWLQSGPDADLED